MKRSRLITAATLALSLFGTAAFGLEAPQDVVKNTTDQVVERVRNERNALRADPARMYELVSEMIFPHFDFSIMSQWVLGEQWAAADDAQRAEFVEQFRKLLVRTYAAALLEYSDQIISYPADQAPAKPNTAVVMQQISQPGTAVLPVVYRLHNKTGNWKVFDVSVDGVSLVKTYKASFAPIISEGGLDRLIQTLDTKNQEISR